MPCRAVDAEQRVPRAELARAVPTPAVVVQLILAMALARHHASGAVVVAGAVDVRRTVADALVPGVCRAGE
jgi:hypothetical protein